MAYKDLREFIAQLEKYGELHRVTKEVDWNLELGNIMKKVYQIGGPAVLFERVKDSKLPVLSGTIGTFKRYALGVDAPPEPRAIIQKVIHATENPVAPVLVKTGPCKENIDIGDSIDLYKFPSPRWHYQDGGRYIGTTGVVITKDPETGARNMGIYREQLLGRDKTGLNATQHSGIMLEKYRALNRPMPVATAIGVSPAVLAASTVSVPYGEDELDIAGGIAGEPIRLVKCETVDLEVPADAEIVLEGEVSPDESEWEEEGPFGEFSGYSVSAKKKRPSVHLTAVSYRNNAIFQGTSPGVPPNEDVMLRCIGVSAGVLHKLRLAGVPGVKEAYATLMGCSDFMHIISMERQFYLGNARQAIDVVWGTQIASKWVIVVDDDIDIYDSGQVEWALATRVQPHRDIIITDDRYRSSQLDPSIHPDVIAYPHTQSSKIGIDATRGFKGFKFPSVVRPTAAEVAEIEKRWHEYGFS